MEQAFQLHNIVGAIVYAALGVVLLCMSFAVFDLITPGKMWKEIVEEKNLPLAITLAAMTIAVGNIIASAIHG
ncbi:MAG: DUF350 domain-containing protein [Candidatus Melainabacteria bacterium]|nr:DUF350 domain-containing protein [Candidatus Melainabacteria bacterium]